MQYELYHAGVKGMKWGVRNDKDSSTGISRKSRKSNTTTIKTVKRKNTSSVKRKNTKTSITNKKKKRGAKVVANKKNIEVNTMVSNTVNVTAGAMRVAAAFVPGLSVLNGVATATSLVGTIATLKK